MGSKSMTAEVEVPSRPEVQRDRRAKPKRQPPYHVILWNDEDHSYVYVVRMLQRLFGHPPERGFALAREVDRRGRAIVLTTTREHAELKRDQILAFGPDALVASSRSSMGASIEPAPEP
jgi:ATP-dependent Clp protease adaptor protein ClpS